MPDIIRFGQVISQGAVLPSSPVWNDLFYLTADPVGTYVCDRLGAWVLWDNTIPAALVVTSTTPGLVPATGGGTTDFLRADATFDVPSGGSGGDLLAANNLSDVASASTSRTNLGLGNVNNTSDASKPVSSATQTALDGKQVSGSYATGTGTANGTNTGDQTTVSGNAGTATTLQTARNINGVSFNGSANITVTAAGSTLTGSTLSAGLIGTAGTQAAAGNDARLSDARTPTAHAASHTDGGSDEIAIAAVQVTSGVLAMARLATGTPDGTKFIRDDGTLVTPGGGAAWGGITGTLSNQTDVQAALDAKQATLVSGTNIKTINGATVLGSGNLSVSASDPSYTPGSFTVSTGTGRLVIKRMQLSTTERATIAGTARLKVA